MNNDLYAMLGLYSLQISRLVGTKLSKACTETVTELVEVSG